MKKKRKGKKVIFSKTEWQWGYEKWEGGERIRGATIEGNKIRWWSETYPGYAGGLSSTQGIRDFLLHGPKAGDVPLDVATEIKEVIESAYKKGRDDNFH